MFGTPSCPDCGSRFLVERIRTTGALLPPSERYYRCWRCFEKFTPDEGEPDGTADQRGPDPSRLVDESEPRAEVAAVDLELEEAGTKLAVEEFVVTVENGTDRPLPVTGIRLTFEDGEERAAPKNEVVVGPNGRESIEVRWSWFHPDQRAVTVEVLSGDETVATADMTLPRA